MKKQHKQTNAIKKVTIIFGYALFFLSLISLTISTIIPMGVDLLDPTVRHFNVTMLFMSLVLGAVLPPLVSYLIGDRATHSKSKVDHHFNGVLFGVASYWLSTFFSFIGAETISSIRGAVPESLSMIIPSWPVLPTIVIMAAVAVAYVKKKKKPSSVLEYRPYQLVLFIALVATFAYTLFNMSYTGTEWVASILYIVIPAALIGASYVVLPVKNYSSSTTRLAAAVVAVTIGFIAASVAGQLIPFLDYNAMAPIVAGLIVLALYLVLMRRIK